MTAHLSSLYNNAERSANRQLRHLSDSIVLEESSSPHLIQASMISISAVILLFFLWASFARISEVARAMGEVVPAGYVQAVQHLEGGMVSQIYVREGDLVEKDQKLLHLDGANIRAELEKTRTRQLSLTLQAARLQAFIYDNNPRFDKIAGDFPGMATSEKEILQGMQEDRIKQKRILQDQITQRQNDLRAIRTRRVGAEENVKLAREENAMRQSLLKEGMTSKILALDAKRRLNTTEGEIRDIVSQERGAISSISEAQNRLISLDASLRESALTKLGGIKAELAEVDRVVANLDYRIHQLDVRSPVRGLVKGISISTIGAVVSPGETLLEIVPVDQELLVEGLIAPHDVGHLKVGQDVQVKVAAFDYTRYGSVKGQLETISPSTFTGKDGRVYYKVKVKLSQNYVGKNPGANLILPGMTVQADVITGDKTLLQYLLKPVHQALSTGFQER